MAQTWTDDVFDRTHAHNTDLQNMEDNFASLKSLFSGAAAPASMAACHPWFDTTQHVLKVRNDGNAAWLGLMHGDASQKIWVYRNAAMDGWAIDAAVEDRVLSLKGGATYTAGAATAGSWTIGGLASGNESAHTHTLDAGTDVAGGVTYNKTTGAGSAHSHTVSHDGSSRPAAAVGTLQYLDLT